MATWHGQVESTEWLTPTLVRVVLGGDGLTGFAVPEATDTYVNVAIPPAGAPYGAVFSPAEVRESHPKETWPARRRYTVRDWDAAAGLLSLDFVVHGDEGAAGPWAARAVPGDVLVFEGPGSGYLPDPSADWHLLVGDESAVPAITAALEALPADAVTRVVILVEDAAHEPVLPLPAGAELTVLHRASLASGESLGAAVRALEWLPGRVHAFVHGEAQEVMHGIRPYLLTERGLARDQVSISGYWRRGRSEEGFRQWKAELRAAEEDQLTR